MRLPPAWLVAVLLAGSLNGAWPAQGQVTGQPAIRDPAPGGIDDELARQKQIADRFMSVLARNPRRGTALDKIYSFHLENGSLEVLALELRERTVKNATDGAGWMILGLVESLRGRDAAAVEALTKASDLRPNDALAAYYLGQSLLLIGQSEQAAAAFETAISRQPPRADLLEIFQALGRLHQRAQNAPAALAVWNRLEQLFPNDERVQEQIALTLAEEGQLAAALPRYEALAKIATDEYRRTAYRIEAADLKVKLGRSSEGVADLEGLLAKLNPDNWLFRDVRRRIEEVYLRTDDDEGLARYYAAWLARHADDIDAMARLARVLARQSRVSEAQQWLDKALQLAPSRKELRLAFIEQLVDDQRYAEAIRQYAELDKAQPNNADFLRDWGKLVLRDTSRPKTERLAEAERIWRRIVAARPADPLAATQAADLLRQAELTGPALALYQQAVELAPLQPQYREYLGEYLHILKRPDEALSAWRQIAAGNRRTAANLTRLAEVLAQFGYLNEALPQIAAACVLEPKDLSLQLKAADLQARAEQYDVALASLSRARALAQNDEEREVVLAQRLKTLTLQNKLADLAAQLEQETARAGAAAQQWYLLARCREALREWPQARRAIERAIELEPLNLPALAAAARIFEQSGDLERAAVLNRKLAVADRRSRSVYLQHVAQLQSQLGQTDEALAAGRELLAAAPGNVEAHQFFADLCFRLNQVEEGLAALRRAVRANPNEPSILQSLAAALAGQFRTEEAIEIYWQALEKAPRLDDRLTVIDKLTDLYLQTNRFDQLLERLARDRRQDDQRRELTICLAQAHQSAGDFRMAREELETLLDENSRDTQLLAQLSKLAESESDLPSAVRFQEQLARLAPGAETEFRLATLLSRAGQDEQAAAIFVRLAGQEEDQERLLRNLDGLLNSGQNETALAVLEERLRQNPADWELLYRQGIALSLRRSEESPRPFQTLLALAIPDDEPGVAGKNRRKNQSRTSPAAPAAISPVQSRLNLASTIRIVARLDSVNATAAAQRQFTNWRPADFGQARLAAIAWLLRLATDAGQADPFAAEFGRRAAAGDATPREMWDWVYLQSLLQNHAELRQIARRLAEQGGRDEHLLYLTQLSQTSQQQVVIVSGAPTLRQTFAAAPPSPDELDLAVACYRQLRAADARFGAGTPSLPPQVTLTLLAHLRQADRKTDADEIYKDAVQSANSPDAIAFAAQLASQQGDRENFLSLLERLAAKEIDSPGAAAASVLSTGSAALIAAEIARPTTSGAEALALVDRFLGYHAAKINRQLASGRPPPASMPSATALQRLVPVLVNGRITYRPSSSSARSQAGNPAFLAPSRYFDASAVQLLLIAAQALQQKGLANELVPHLVKRSQNAPAAEKLYALLALTHAQGWRGDRKAALATLQEAAALVPQDAGLRLDIARLHIQAQQFSEALTAAEAAVPTDQDDLQQRETLVLDLALRLNNQERARQAAQRLFGMRLSPAEQLALANQMRRAGMNDEASAILARTRQQAAGSIATLAALMREHQSQGKTDVAAEVAHQILRRTRRSAGAAPPAVARPANAPTSPGVPAGAVAASAAASAQIRQEALRLLAQSGKLEQLIAGLEQQIERSPQATQLFESLAEYYQAAGETDKLLDVQVRLLDLRPDNGQQRLRLAQQLRQRGRLADACDQYKLLIGQQPQLAVSRSSELFQTFQQAGRDAELAEALGAIDLKSLGTPAAAIDLIRGLLRSPQGSLAGGELFRKAFESFPDQRQRLMTGLANSQMRQRPDFLELGKRALVPTDDDLRREAWRQMWQRPDFLEMGKRALVPADDDLRREAWHGIAGGSLSFDSGGQIRSTNLQVLDALEQAKQLAALRTEVAAASAARPQWLGGSVLLALIDLRLGPDAAPASVDLEQRLQPLLSAAGNEFHLRHTRWIMAQELQSRPELRELAIRLYRQAAPGDGKQVEQFRVSPAQRLVQLLRASGRTEEARQTLLEAARAGAAADGFDQPANHALRADNLLAIGGLLHEMDHPADALRLYRELLAGPDYNEMALTAHFGRPPGIRQVAERNIQAILKEAREKPSAALVVALLAPSSAAPPQAAVVDLMLGWNGNPGPLPRMESPLAELIRPGAIGAEGLAQIEARLAALQAQHPRDISVQVAATLFALQGMDERPTRAALARLSELVASSPLSEIPAGQRATPAHKQEAAGQLGLWLVARQCLQRGEHRRAGLQLADRAIPAARRQADPEQVMALLYELGGLALEAGDRATAQRAWDELIDLALVEPRQGRLPSAAAAGGTAAQTVARQPKPVRATRDQFNLAAALADQAAEHDLAALSLRAIREALSGGLPDSPPTRSPIGAARLPVAPGVRPSGANLDPSSPSVDPAKAEFAARLGRLSPLWRRHDLAAAEVCQVLESLVFPAARPIAIDLYEQPLTRELSNPQSIGRLLVEWSLRGGRAENIEQQVTARRGTTADAIAGRVLLVQLAVASGQPQQAREHLQALASETATPTLTSYLEMAAHAAAAALADSQLTDDALPLLDRWAAASLARRSPASDRQAEADAIATVLARLHLATGNLAAAESHVARYIKSWTPVASASEEGNAYLRRLNLAWGANELARGGDLATTLASLGRFADSPAPRFRDAQVNVALWHLARQLERLPPHERYERLRDWTLPAAERGTVRIVAGFDSGQPIPAVFLTAAAATYEPSPRGGPLSNLTLLVEAAAAAGRLDELSQAAEAAGAEPLALLTLIARGDTGAARPRLEALAARLVDALPEGDDQRNRPPIPAPGDYLLARAALASPQLTALGRRVGELMLDQAEKSGQQDLAAHLSYDLAQPLPGRASAERERILTPPLALWLAAGPRANGAARPPPLWSAHEGHLVHRGGHDFDALFFKYPLAGEFELAYEAYTAIDSQSAVGYGGLFCGSQYSPHRAVLWSLTQHEQLALGEPVEKLDGWNRVHLRVGPTGASFFINGHKLHEDRSPSAAAPWLTLHAVAGHRLALRNLRLTGQPVIPRSVNLVVGERLDGWNAQFYSQSVPPRLAQKDAAAPPDWRASGGVLTGRLAAAAGDRSPGHLYYQRPLNDGERVRYQFRYEPGRTHVHPTLGRVAFLLEPAGVRLHWLTHANNSSEPLLIDERNSVEEPASRRGPPQMPLKENDWNDAELAIENGDFTIRLNGELVCQRPIEPTSDRRFGLFHWQGETSAEVRSILLTGNWPASLTAAQHSDLLALAAPDHSAAHLRARHALIGEHVLAGNAYHVWQQARALPAREKYAALRQWILPGDTHPTFRVPVVWTPNAPRGRSATGNVVSPALDLIAAATELDRLDELAWAVAAAAKEFPDQARHAVAFEALLAMARGDEAAAAALLEQLLALARRQPPDTPLHERHGAWLAAFAALRHPPLRKTALALAVRLVHEQKLDTLLDRNWERRARRLLAEAQWANDPGTANRPFGDVAANSPWQPAYLPTAEDRGEGFAPAAWRLAPGEAACLSAGGREWLFFAVPLSGDFELRCQRPLVGWRDLRPVYGGSAPERGADVLPRRLIEGPRPGNDEEAGQAARPYVDYRLVVEGGVLRTFVNEKEIHSGPLPADADPWLAIEASGPHSQARLINLQVIGQPTIPREICLSASPDLALWSADYYGDALAAPNRFTPWTKNGEQIIGRRLDSPSGSFRQSVLQYRRPLLEDGEVKYEFFYEAGRTEVHPAVGRLAFLLDPAGVKLHRLTDAQFDRSGSLPDNAELLAPARALPLKVGEWNQLHLAVQGDIVTIDVNGVQVARRNLEPTNSRIFGLFHFADATAVKVKNVVHRGRWPSRLPPAQP